MKQMKFETIILTFGIFIAALAAHPVQASTVVDPDAFADGTDISNAFDGVTLSVITSGIFPGSPTSSAGPSPAPATESGRTSLPPPPAGTARTSTGAPRRGGRSRTR